MDSDRRQFLDHFAECLSGGGSVAQCAGRLGKSPGWGGRALKEIRKGLGSQAR